MFGCPWMARQGSRRLGGGCNVLRLGLGEVSKRAANLKLIFKPAFSASASKLLLQCWRCVSVVVGISTARLSLGYIKLGQVDLQTSFQDTKFQGIYESMKNNLNISRIQISGDENIANDFPYTLESDNWKQIQMEGLESGYKSRLNSNFSTC